MKPNTWKLVATIAAIVMLAGALVALIMGGCTGMLECGDKQVPMKCHWTFAILPYICAGGVITSLIALVAKQTEGRRFSAIATLLFAALGLVALSPAGIGICAKPEMTCNGTAPIMYAALILAIVVSLVMIAKASVEEAEKPKLQL